jgi:hypothetical protein
MADVWPRVALVAGALLAVLVVVLVLRRSGGGGVERSSTPLAAGVYLFTSSTCADCVGAREKLVEHLGGAGFVEIAWEEDPETFSREGIDVVPCTVVVAGDGSATRFPGIPELPLDRFNP